MGGPRTILGFTANTWPLRFAQQYHDTCIPHQAFPFSVTEEMDRREPIRSGSTNTIPVLHQIRSWRLITHYKCLLFVTACRFDRYIHACRREAMAEWMAEAETRTPGLAPWRNLEGKVVMVTGASSGIGRDLCLDLARAGCLVIAAARRTDRLRSLCEEINGSGPSQRSAVRSVAIALDVSADEPSIAASVQRACDAFGRIDGLVNNAGVRGNLSF